MTKDNEEMFARSVEEIFAEIEASRILGTHACPQGKFGELINGLKNYHGQTHGLIAAMCDVESEGVLTDLINIAQERMDYFAEALALVANYIQAKEVITELTEEFI